MRTNHLSTFPFLLAFGVVVGCGVENSIVDGSCRDGYSQLGSRCVAIESSPASEAAAEPPSGTPATGGASTTTAPRTTAPFGPATAEEIGPRTFTGSDAGATTTTPPADASTNTPLVCTAPEVACHGACIDVSSDPQNCGACGKICPSNICSGGLCQGATPGDVVAIGHAFASSWNGSSQLKVLVNAIAIPTSDPIRVLAFDGDAPAKAADDTRKLIASAIKGRSVSFTKASSASSLESSALARDYDVVLLHAATTSDSALAARVATSFDTFTRKGGVLVALDDGTSEMPKLLTDSGMLTVTSHTTLGATSKVVVAAPGDAVGVQVISPYAPSGATVGFTGIAAGPDITVVVKEQEGQLLPVVVHRVVY